MRGVIPAWLFLGGLSGTAWLKRDDTQLCPIVVFVWAFMIRARPQYRFTFSLIPTDASAKGAVHAPEVGGKTLTRVGACRRLGHAHWY